MCSKRKPPAISVSVFSGINVILGIVVMALAINYYVNAGFWSVRSDQLAADPNVEKFRD